MLHVSAFSVHYLVIHMKLLHVQQFVLSDWFAI